MRARRFWSSNGVQCDAFYTALGDVHDAMLWLGAQLRV